MAFVGLPKASAVTNFFGRVFRGLSSALLLSTALLGQPPQAPNSAANATKGATIKANVRQVLIDVVVTDTNDQPVKGLTQEDFTVYEDGARQQILSFGAHATSSKAALVPMPPLPPNTFRNLPVADTAAPLNVLLYDVLNTPLSDQAYAHDEIVRFLRNRPPGGRFAIFVLSDKLHLLQGFTDDDQQLLSAMNRKESDPHTSALNSTTVMLSSAERVANAGAFANDPALTRIILRMERVESAEANFFLSRREEQTIQAFQEIAHFLAGLSGRKNLIWLSGSFPTSIFSGSNPLNPFGTTINYSEQLREATKMLTVGQVAVYPVDTRGLPGNPAFSGTAARRSGAGDVPLFSEHAIMNQIAEDTGGHAFYFTNGLAEAMALSTADGSNYYSLAYSPTNTNFNGHERKIRLKLPQNKARTLHLSYRHSYLADDDAMLAKKAAHAPEDRLQNAAIRGAPLAHDLGLEVQIHTDGPPAPVTPNLILRLAAYPAFASRDNWNDVAVQSYQVDYTIRSGHLSFNPSPDGTHQGKFEFQFAAYDEENRAVFGQWTRAETLYSAKQIDELATGHFHFQQTLAIPTQAAWLRLIVRDVIGDHIGSLEIPLPLSPEPDPAHDVKGQAN